MLSNHDLGDQKCSDEPLVVADQNGRNYRVQDGRIIVPDYGEPQKIVFSVEPSSPIDIREDVNNPGHWIISNATTQSGNNLVAHDDTTVLFTAPGNEQEHNVVGIDGVDVDYVEPTNTHIVSLDIDQDNPPERWGLDPNTNKIINVENPADGPERVTGPPTSATGSSTASIFWGGYPSLPNTYERVTVDFRLNTTIGSTDPFQFALQTEFLNASGAPIGSGRLALQHIPAESPTGAVNLSGLDVTGTSVLPVTPSNLTAIPAVPDSFVMAWVPNRWYQLSIARLRTSVFQAEVTDMLSGQVITVGEINPPNGESLSGVINWGESFEDCDYQQVCFEWKDPTLFSANSPTATPSTGLIDYLSYTAGGCSNTNTQKVGTGLMQCFNAPRTNPAGAVLTW